MSPLPEKIILIVDADPQWAIRISGFLLKADFKTALSLSSAEALEMIEQLHPQVIVFNIDQPVSSEETIFTIASTSIPPIPVLVTTSRYNYESQELAHVLRRGAFDFLLKPYSSEMLLHKIELAIANNNRAHRIVPHYDYSAFFAKIKQLNATRHLETLLDISFDYFILLTRADNAILYLFNKEKHSWQKVREKREIPGFPEEPTVQEILHNVIISGQPLMDDLRDVKPRDGVPFTNESTAPAFIALPLIAGNEPAGVALLQRRLSATPFLPSDIQAAEIIATQVGCSLANISLHETAKQKLHELHIISSYSKKLMRMINKYDVLTSLCETAVRQVNVDFTGFFIMQRRAHEFLYWSRYAVDEKTLQNLCDETIAVYNRSAATTLRTRRIVFTPFDIDNIESTPRLLPPLVFQSVLPLCWDDLKFGAVILGAVKEPDQVTSKKSFLSDLIDQTHIALTNTKLYSDMKENYIRTIKALAIAVDAKDTYTHGHSENVMNITEEIARELSIDEHTVVSIRDAGLLHDIGKIGIPGYILNKPGPLNHEEFNGIMKTHSRLGANIVRDVPFLRDLHRLILYHHEHYDGKGYPEGLRGEQIPLGARIIHVADAFEAMTSDRPYRKSLGRPEAIKRLKKGSGNQFDPAIIAAFLQVSKRKNWLTDTHVNQTFPFAH